MTSVCGISKYDKIVIFFHWTLQTCQEKNNGKSHSISIHNIFCTCSTFSDTVPLLVKTNYWNPSWIYRLSSFIPFCPITEEARLPKIVDIDISTFQEIIIKANSFQFLAWFKCLLRYVMYYYYFVYCPASIAWGIAALSTEWSTISVAGSHLLEINNFPHFGNLTKSAQTYLAWYLWHSLNKRSNLEIRTFRSRWLSDLSIPEICSVKIQWT